MSRFQPFPPKFEGTAASFRIAPEPLPATTASTASTQIAKKRAPSDGPLRIGLLGLFGGGNIGNDGSLEAMILLLRKVRPTAQITSICVGTDLIRDRYKVATEPVSWPGFSGPLLRTMDRVFLKVPGRLANWTRAIKTARRLDLIIIPGTGPLCDYASGPGKSPYGFFRWAAAAKLVGVPLHFICTGSGPITHPLSRMMLMFAARSAATRSFRDGVSKAILAGLGLDTSRDHVFPDLVFRLPVPQAAATLPVAGHPLTYGIGVMDYNGWQPGRTRAVYDEYLRKMARYVARLLSEGHRVRLLMGEKADRGVIADLCRILEQRGHAPLPAAPAVAAPSQLIAEPIDSLHDLMAQIVDTDIVVATRFHNVICALKLARPTVSIGYDAKNEAIMAEMGLAEFSQYIETLDLDRLEEQTAELLRSRSTYTDWIRRRLVDFERRLAEQDAVLISSIV